MFQSATTTDFKRMLGDILNRSKSQIGRSAMEIKSKFTKAGGIGNSRLPYAIEEAIVPFHEQALVLVMRLVVQFAEKIHYDVAVLLDLARPDLMMLNEYCVERIAGIGNGAQIQQVALSAREHFQERVRHAESDLLVGFIDGKVAIVTEPPSSQSRALRVLKAIYDATRDRSQPVFVSELGDAIGLTEQESQAAWRYLRDRGLIDTFNLQYTARINATGIDAIENARRQPDNATDSFPSVTYNIVNNTVHMGSVVNSPVQQAGGGSTQHQTVNYTANQLNELARVLTLIERHFDELRLDIIQSRNARAQIATLKAQLEAEQNPIILQQAGRSLRNITEGAIAGLIAAAVQPSLWVGISEAINQLFS